MNARAGSMSRPDEEGITTQNRHTKSRSARGSMSRPDEEGITTPFATSIPFVRGSMSRPDEEGITT